MDDPNEMQQIADRLAAALLNVGDDLDGAIDQMVRARMAGRLSQVGCGLIETSVGKRIGVTTATDSRAGHVLAALFTGTLMSDRSDR